MTEQRVADALWDVIDLPVARSEIWDQHSEGFGAVFFTLAHHVNTTLSSFWRSRGTDGFDVSDAALGSLCQNTVDYGYRRPLTDGRGQFLPTFTSPAPPQNFGLNTEVQSWSVVALRPSSPTDFDLTLYDNRAQTLHIGSSTLNSETLSRRPVPGRTCGWSVRICTAPGRSNHTISRARDASARNTAERCAEGAVSPSLPCLREDEYALVIGPFGDAFQAWSLRDMTLVTQAEAREPEMLRRASVGWRAGQVES
ncbi:hypothetical protein ABZ379_42135 [Streptomyces canus]|uniref:hypothetical protein n=1 Tax=Streptomyces canus TaxID=58343 RepID=UPI0033F1BDEE